MLPLVTLDAAKIAPLQPYGACCALGFFVGDWFLMKLAMRRGFDRADFRVLTILLGVLGWLFAWGVDVVFYDPAISGGSRFTMQGFSSTGAIVGATIGALLWSRFDFRKGLTRREAPLPFLPISEVVLAVWPIAFAFGRLGCSLIHDHVGKAVWPGTIGSLFAVGFPREAGDGVHRMFGPFHVITGGSDLRYDLGLLEFIVLAALAIGFARMWHKDVKMGTYTIVSCLVYGPIRFVLDFLRAGVGPTGEVRHGGLTFAQYWSLGVIALGIAVLMWRNRTTQDHPAAPPAEST